MNAPTAAKRRFGFWTILAIIFASVVALLLAAAVALYIQRNSVVALIAQNYLRTRGIDSEVSFSALSMGGFLARVRAGTVDQPDFTAESMEVTFVYLNDGMTPGIAAVKLVRPFLRVGYDGEKLSFGSLQALIDEALAQAPEGEGPAVSIEKGDVLLVTPNGNVRFTADLEIANRRVLHVDASLQPGRLQGEGIAGAFSAGTLKADARGEFLDGSATLKLDSLTYQGNSAKGAELAADIRGLKWQGAGNSTRFAFAAGNLTLRSAAAIAATLAAASSEMRVAVEGVEGDFAAGRVNVRARGNLDVQLAGANFGGVITAARFTERIDIAAAELQFADGALRIAANGTSRVEVVNAGSGEASLARLTAETTLPTLTANITQAGWSLEGTPRTVLNGAGLRYRLKDGTITSQAFRVEASANGTLRDGSTQGTARLSLSGRANIPRAISLPYATASGDAALAASIVTALETVTLQTASLEIARSDAATIVTSATPIVLDGMGGAKITLSPREGPLLNMAGADMTGALGLDIRGGGLPPTRLALTSYRYGGGNFDAQTEFETALDLDYLPGLQMSGRGRLQSAGTRTAFDLAGCADVRFASLLNGGVVYLRDASAQICGAPPQPLFVGEPRGWRIEARLDDVAAKFETAGSALANGEGRLQIAGQGAGLQNGRVEIAQAELSDLLAPARYLPVSATGAMNLANDEWRGDVTVTTGERRLANVALRHAMQTGTGSAAIDAQGLVFAPNQLQPADIVPFLGMFGTRVAGMASFTGRLGWSKDGITSDGRVVSTGLGLQSAAGGVRGVSFNLKLDSLLPLAVAPAQSITAQRIDTFVPIENIAAQFTYTPESFRLDSASAAVAGGRLVLDPLSYNFASASTTRGVVHLENLNVEPLIEAAGLTGRVTSNAKIGGNVPFTLSPEGLRFDNGRVAAIGAGRLSIRREALTGGVGVGDPNQVAPNAVQDFAYQALENMAFDVLEGEISSRPMGRLGMIFRIKGRNDPMVALETRVGVVQLLRGEAFNAPLPLPKGTPVDLTLDASINLDELLKSYFGGSAPAP
ncbi:MAG: hypothetical protein EXR00_01795 [Alphaproteobacteria bacterium]|nr:hypothetical protein [Alphaproteobacteria bacterium]